MGTATQDATPPSTARPQPEPDGGAIPDLSRSAVDVVQIPLAELCPHPHQASGEFYEAPSTADFDRLYQDIVENGLRDPIHVLPPGNRAGLPGFTVLDGHTRLAVYRRKLEIDGEIDEGVRAKYRTIPAVIRHDLLDKTPEEIERLYLECNNNRRQLHMLDRARVARRLYELERGKRRTDAAETRDIIGKRLGISGVTLSRWMRAIDAPAIVRDLLKRGIIPLMAAARIGLLPPETRSKLAGEVANAAAWALGATSRREKLMSRKAVLAVVDRYVARPGSRHVTEDGAVRSLVKSLERGLQDLSDRVDQVRVFAEDLETLRAGARLLAKLEQRVASRAAPITVIGESSTEANSNHV